MAKPKLSLRQEQRYYDYGRGKEKAHVSLRIIYPSQPCGYWCGNQQTIREWQQCPEGTATYQKCSQKEIRKFEKMVGELEKVLFLNHPALGLVSHGPLRED